MRKMEEGKECDRKIGSKVKKIQLDELDSNLVQELKADCKQTWKELAKKLGVSPVTVMNRVRALEENGVIIGYTALVDHAKLGYEFSAVQALLIESDSFYEVIDAISKMPEVEAVYAISGDFDALTVLRAKNRNEFTRIVRTIYRMKGVKSSITYFSYAMKEYYRESPSSQRF